jgi:hypothetical protein
MRVSIGDDELLPPWPTVFEIAEHTDTGAWVLIGGLMVQVHAIAAGITPPRPTRDVDVVVDVATAAGRFVEVSTALRGAGFDPHVPDQRTASIYRFARGHEEVDVMVPDHLPAHVRPRFMQRRRSLWTQGPRRFAAASKWESLVRPGPRRSEFRM